jgi:hypothetical protein
MHDRSVGDDRECDHDSWVGGSGKHGACAVQKPGLRFSEHLAVYEDFAVKDMETSVPAQWGLRQLPFRIFAQTNITKMDVIAHLERRVRFFGTEQILSFIRPRRRDPAHEDR